MSPTHLSRHVWKRATRNVVQVAVGEIVCDFEVTCDGIGLVGRLAMETEQSSRRGGRELMDSGAETEKEVGEQEFNIDFKIGKKA